MPTAYILVGVPGSGKSTWVRNQRWCKDCTYVSTDKFVEQHARRVKKTYGEVFDSYMPQAVDRMAKQVIRACEADRDIIWDQTSTTLASRARKFRMLPGYRMIAIVFPTPDHDELQRRLASRHDKIIPTQVVEKMIADWEEPAELEGFDEIWRT
jgi:predicted kinase